MDIKELLAKCEDVESKISEDDELGLFIQTTGSLYDKYIAPAIQGKGKVAWDRLVREGARLYKREIDATAKFGEKEFASAKEYLQTYFKDELNESVIDEGRKPNYLVTILCDKDNEKLGKHVVTVSASSDAEAAQVGQKVIDKQYPNGKILSFEKQYNEDFKPAEMEKAEYKEIDIKEPEVEKLKEEKNLAETPAEMETAEYKDMKIEKPEVEKAPKLNEDDLLDATHIKTVQSKIWYKNGQEDTIQIWKDKEGKYFFISEYIHNQDINNKKYNSIEELMADYDKYKEAVDFEQKFDFQLGDALVEVTNSTNDKITAEDVKAAIEKENPPIFFNNADSYHYIMDFSFEKDGKKYWIESKNIDGDFSKFELNIYEGFNESVAGSLVKELTLFESKEVRTMIEGSEEKPAEMEKAEYDEVKPIKPEVDENGKKAEKELKEGVEDKTVNFMNKPLHYKFFNKKSDGGFVTLEVGKGELKDNDEDCYILVGYSANTNQFRFTVIYEDSEKNCDIADSFLKDDISKADLENLKNALYDEYGVDKTLEESRADKIRKGAYKRVKHESLTKDEYQVIVRNVYGENAIIKNASNLANAKEIRDDLKSKLKSSPIYILKDGKIIDESLNEATEADINRMIEKVYGKVGNKKDEYFLQGTTIYQRMEDNGGVKRILDASTKGKLYDLLCELKAYKNFLIDAGKMAESLNEAGAGDFKYQIGDMIKMTRKAQAEGRRLFGTDFKAIKGEVINRFNGGIDMPNVYTVKMADGSEETVAETLVEFWGTKRKKEPVGESVKNPIESIHTGRNIYIKLNPKFENISLSELFKIIELGGTEKTNSFWRTVIREKRGHITIKRNENESDELIFYPNTWKDKNFKIKTVAGVPFEDTLHAYGFAKNESFEDKTVNEEEKIYYLYAGYYELYLTDHKLTPPYMYQAENTDLNQLINDNISEIDDEGEWINPDAAFSTDSATICFDKNIIDELNKTDLFGGEIDMYHDALSDAEFNGEDEDKVKEDYHIYDLSKYYADKNESMNEVSLENAVDSNDKRQYNSLKAELKAKASGEEADEKEAEKLADKATKSNELLKRWKKAKGIEESAQVVVAKFDDGLHEIVKCDKGYFNRYNIKDGKARFTTKCVESLPTAVGALKRRFPNASEDVDVNESLNEEFINFEGYRFKGIVNPKTGEIIYSKLSPKYGRILDADLRININDKEDFNNREIIKAAKEVITKE